MLAKNCSLQYCGPGLAWPANPLKASFLSAPHEGEIKRTPINGPPMCHRLGWPGRLNQFQAHQLDWWFVLDRNHFVLDRNNPGTATWTVPLFYPINPGGLRDSLIGWAAHPSDWSIIALLSPSAVGGGGGGGGGSQGRSRGARRVISPFPWELLSRCLIQTPHRERYCSPPLYWFHTLVLGLLTSR